jgi:hypothetical protein
MWNNKILIPCCILLGFFYILFYGARIHEHQVTFYVHCLSYYIIILEQKFTVFEIHLFEPIKTRKEICLTVTNIEATELSPRSLKQ